MLKKQFYTFVLSMISVVQLVISKHEIPNTFSYNEIAKMKDCVLCSACNSANDRSNKYNSTCTLAENVQYLNTDDSNFTINDECYKLGDYSELICSERNLTHISILPPRKGDQDCKFNISYYDVSIKSFVPTDTLFVRFGNSKALNIEMTSYNGFWKVVHKRDYRRKKILGSKNFKFDIKSLTGNNTKYFNHSNTTILNYMVYYFFQ